MLEPNRLTPRRPRRPTHPSRFLASSCVAPLTLLVLAVGLPAPAARACTDDKDCKGDRICDRSVCKTPRAAPSDAPPAAVALTSSVPARPAQMVIVEPRPTAAPGSQADSPPLPYRRRRW